MATNPTIVGDKSINPEHISQYYIEFMTHFREDADELFENNTSSKNALFIQRYGQHAYDELVRHHEKATGEGFAFGSDFINGLLTHHFSSSSQSDLSRNLGGKYPAVNQLIEQYLRLKTPKDIKALSKTLYGNFPPRLDLETKQLYCKYYPGYAGNEITYNATIPSIAEVDCCRIVSKLEVLCQNRAEAMKERVKERAIEEKATKQLNHYLHCLGEVTIDSSSCDIQAYNAAQEAIAILQGELYYSGFLVTQCQNSNASHVTSVRDIAVSASSNTNRLNTFQTHLEKNQTVLINGNETLGFLVNELISWVKSCINGTETPSLNTTVLLGKNQFGTFYHTADDGRSVNTGSNTSSASWLNVTIN